MDINTLAYATILFLFFATTNSTIVLDGNGYSNILVAISEDIAQSEGDGVINNIKDLLTETSAALHKATGSRVYLKNIDIMTPYSWNINSAQLTRERSFQQSDIRITTGSTFGTLPYTSHSGKCGVAGNYIMIPNDFLTSNSQETDVKIKAKAMVQQWAQLRYGVFDEHGYPDDKLLPYFYRHPDGYDAITSSNDTIIKGDLISLSTEENCPAEAGVITNKEDCRFIPSSIGQTAKTSLMSFHWLDTVIEFSNAPTHDRRPPHRQNRLCDSKSSWEIISNLPDISGIAPDPGQSTVPSFRYLKNPMLPVVYLAIDKSMPTSTANAAEQGQNVFKQGMRNLFNNYLSKYPDLLVAWSTFKDMDSGANNYLVEEIAPKRIGDNINEFLDIVNEFVYSTDVLTRDVSAVIREAESRLRKYKDVGGSILYIVTSTESTTKDTVVETELAERLLLNNIKLEVAESGPGTKVLSRFSTFSQGSYYFKESWGTFGFFNQIGSEIENLCQNGLKSERRMIISKKSSISISNSWTGSFSIDETVGTNTTVALQSPTQGSFVVTLTNPIGQQVDLPNDPEVTNWNFADSTIRVVSKRLPNPADIGRWTYSIKYDTTGCPDCEPQPKIHLQIGSSILKLTTFLPICRPWVSLTAGLEFVDMSRNPAVIQAKFDANGGRIGDLIVTADIILNGDVVDSIPLSDTGTMDSDISKDGIYSTIYYPAVDGTYTVNMHTLHNSALSAKINDRLLASDQENYCCGSRLPTASLNHFQSIVNDAIVFEVRNAQSATKGSSPVVTDLNANTYGIDDGKVYTELTWTVPINTKSQLVKYSESDVQLLDNFSTAQPATIVYGNLNNVDAGTFVYVYATAPYTEGKNVYFIVETTGPDNQKIRSHLVWSESNPPENPFTSPVPTSSTASTTSTTPTSTTSITTTTETGGSSTSAITSIPTSTAENSSPSNGVTDPSGSSTTSPSSSTTSPSSISTSTPQSSPSSTSTTGPSSTPISSSTTTSSATTGQASSTPMSSSTTISSSWTTGEASSSETTDPDFTMTSDITDESTSPNDVTTTSSTGNPQTEGPGDGGDDSDDGLSPAEIGYIVGGVVGGIILIGGITGTVIYCNKKKTRNAFPPPSAAGSAAPVPNTPYAAPPTVYVTKPQEPKVYTGVSNGNQQPTVRAVEPSAPSTLQPSNQNGIAQAYDIEDDDDMLMTSL